MGYVKEIIDRFLRIQNRFYPEAEEYFSMGAGNVSLLRVVGVDGESVLLKCDGRRVSYARGDEAPVHILRCTTDTFLDLLSGEENLRTAVTKGHFVIESASNGHIDLVECEKWSKAFGNFRGILKKYLGVRL